MYEQIFDEDPLTQTRRVIYRDPYEKVNTIVATQDVTDIVAENRELFKESDGRWKDAFNHVASIPIGLYFELKKQGIIDNPERFKKWLNSSENQAFRTRPGRV